MSCNLNYYEIRSGQCPHAEVQNGKIYCSNEKCNESYKMEMKNFKKGNTVIMHTCIEADKYNGKIWTCSGDSYIDKAGQECVFLEGFSGCFFCGYLQLVRIESVASVDFAYGKCRMCGRTDTEPSKWFKRNSDIWSWTDETRSMCSCCQNKIENPFRTDALKKKYVYVKVFTCYRKLKVTRTWSGYTISNYYKELIEGHEVRYVIDSQEDLDKLDISKKNINTEPLV